jgi:hypothetical protein
VSIGTPDQVGTETGFPAERGHPLLLGVVGSTVYGLATPDSDIDRLGIYAAPTRAFHGLRPPTDANSTFHRTGPDVTMHEVGKWARLALGMNPTVYELLWLPRRFYEYVSPQAEELIELRGAFLSRQAVRNAYFGYATQQLRKLQSHGGFGNGMDKRGAKNARHLLRLLLQGAELYCTGRLTVHLADPDRVREFGRIAVANPDHAVQTLATFEQLFDTAVSPLPEQPDTARVDRWLRDLRGNLFTTEVQ